MTAYTIYYEHPNQTRDILAACRTTTEVFKTLETLQKKARKSDPNRYGVLIYSGLDAYQIAVKTVGRTLPKQQTRTTVEYSIKTRRTKLTDLIEPCLIAVTFLTMFASLIL